MTEADELNLVMGILSQRGWGTEHRRDVVDVTTFGSHMKSHLAGPHELEIWREGGIPITFIQGELSRLLTDVWAFLLR